MRNKIITSTLVFAGVLLGSAIYARAQTTSSTPSTGLAVSPPTFEVSGNPGDVIKNSIKLENMNTYPVEIAVDRRNFTAIGEDGAVGLTEEDTSFSLASWITVEPSSITLPPKTSQYFSFSIKVPLNAEPGGHFGSLIFRTIPKEKIEGSGASLAQEIGSLVLLRIAGETYESAIIESFDPTQKLFEFGPVTFHARIKNLGNVHTKPYGTVTITNMFGQNVGNVKIDSKNILPGAVRKFEGTWDTKWRIGHYTASFVAVFGDNTQHAKVTSFTIIPYRLVILVVILLAIIFVIFKKHQKRLVMAWKILKSGKI